MTSDPEYLSAADIHACRPDQRPAPGDVTPLSHARATMRRLGLWQPRQQMGRSWPIGCVALEITQRCNLDCTLCYLSEHSEAVRDLPLPEIMRRIEHIHAHYGPGTDVQITGGDPTLRQRDELIAIVRRVSELGLRPTLMTNGIKASRALLQALAEAGLTDVAFHVDTTQERKGYTDEASLNALRLEYLRRAEGLGLSVMFNTTVHRGNFDQLPRLIAFFKANARLIRTASFQLQADTGRGVAGKRDVIINADSVIGQIRAGSGIATLNFDGFTIGHPSCNRYALCLAASGALYDVFSEPALLNRLQSATLAAGLRWDRTRPRHTLFAFGRWLATHPRELLACLNWAGKRAWQMKRDLMASRGRVSTLSFVIHNFMDASALERERIDGCIFKTMTADGPISMCMHNAKRDHYILQPVAISTAPGKTVYWQPLSGELKRKHLKGRAKLAAAGREG